MTRTTKDQRQALWMLWKRVPLINARTMLPMSYRDFRRDASPGFDGSGCIMVPWCGMWIGIERDGYTHS